MKTSSLARFGLFVIYVSSTFTVSFKSQITSPHCWKTKQTRFLSSFKLTAKRESDKPLNQQPSQNVSSQFKDGILSKFTLPSIKDVIYIFLGSVVGFVLTLFFLFAPSSLTATDEATSAFSTERAVELFSDILYDLESNYVGNQLVVYTFLFTTTSI